jgi:nucleotide-binding universal stress UspA family protein
MAEKPIRHVVVALDTTEASLRALKWAATEILRPGDVVHVVHVAKILSPQCVIQHSQPGTSFTVPTTSSDDEATLHTIRQELKTRFAAPEAAGDSIQLGGFTSEH